MIAQQMSYKSYLYFALRQSTHESLHIAKNLSTFARKMSKAEAGGSRLSEEKNVTGETVGDIMTHELHKTVSC